MDEGLKRNLLYKARQYARMIPFFWTFYGLFWRIRSSVEARKKYPELTNLYDFGQYPEPTLDNPTSQLCTANQLICKTYRKWSREIDSPARFSRKQWEFVFILQVLKQSGALSSGKQGLGFGCGREPLVGLFAKYGCEVLATDLDASLAQDRGWVETLQHASSMEGLYSCSKDFISRHDFFDRVSFRSVDMNKIPEDLKDGYDFVWSACALEHLGSIRHGMDFVKNSVRCLKKGGVAVHTTEFNVSSNDKTLEAPGCSIYREKDIKQLIRELESEGFSVEPLNLNTGKHNVDNYVDLPPYGFSPNLKIMLANYVTTSIGLIIRKK